MTRKALWEPLCRAGNIWSVENCLERIIYSFEVNPMVLLPVLIRKYNIPNSYVKRELLEVIYSFQTDYFSCRYFQTFMFNVWLISSMTQSGKARGAVIIYGRGGANLKILCIYNMPSLRSHKLPFPALSNPVPWNLAPPLSSILIDIYFGSWYYFRYNTSWSNTPWRHVCKEIMVTLYGIGTFFTPPPPQKACALIPPPSNSLN